MKLSAGKAHKRPVYGPITRINIKSGMPTRVYMRNHGQMRMTANDNFCSPRGDKASGMLLHDPDLRAFGRVAPFCHGPTTAAGPLRKRHGRIGMDAAEQPLGSAIPGDASKKQIATVGGI